MGQVISQYDQISRLVGTPDVAASSIVRNAANTAWELAPVARLDAAGEFLVTQSFRTPGETLGSGGTALEIRPNPAADAVNQPFRIQGISTNFNGVPDFVVIMGHNIGPGGGLASGAVASGLGDAWESHYEENPGVSEKVERHLHYVPINTAGGLTAGNQYRLYSYTVNQVNNAIEHYRTVSREYLLNPPYAHVSDGQYWIVQPRSFALNMGTPGQDVSHSPFTCSLNQITGNTWEVNFDAGAHNGTPRSFKFANNVAINGAVTMASTALVQGNLTVSGQLIGQNRIACNSVVIGEIVSGVRQQQFLERNQFYGLSPTVLLAELDARNVTNAVRLFLRKATGQTVSLQEWRDESGDTQAKIDQNFRLTVPTLTLSALPTSDPAIAGAVWNDAGTLKISAG